MKHVFSDIDTISHLWAHKKQDNARTPSHNFYFSGGVIYSYGSHFPIACRHTNKKGVEVILFTTDTYSVTTSKHIWSVQRAVSHKDKVYCLNPEDAKRGFHEANLKNFAFQIDKLLPKLIKARKPELYTSDIRNEVRMATAYIEHFRIYKKDTPKKLLKYIKAVSAEDWQSLTKAKEAEVKQMERKRKADIKKRNALMKQDAEIGYFERVNNWQNFGSRYIGDLMSGSDNPYYDKAKHGLTFMRVNLLKNHVETSKHVTMSYPEALRLYRWVKIVASNGGCTDCKQSVNKMYNVDKVTDKLLIAGCHTIHLDECERIGKQLLTLKDHDITHDTATAIIAELRALEIVNKVEISHIHKLSAELQRPAAFLLKAGFLEHNTLIID